MPRSLLAPALAVLAAGALAVGCGGGGGPSPSEPADLAPPDTTVFVEATIRPSGSLKGDLDSLASRVAGVDDLGAALVSELEASAAGSGQPFDYEKEVQPWLGSRAGVFLTGYDGQSFEGTGFAVEVTDADRARRFVDHELAEKGEGSPRHVSYEGVDYEIDPSDGTAVGVIGSFAVLAKDEATFKQAVDAADGESLADADAYAGIASQAPGGALADVYVDVGGLIRQSGSAVDPQVRQLFESAGVELDRSAALISLVPGSDRLEVQLLADLGKAPEGGPTGSSEALLGAMPADSVAAIGAPGFGTRLGRAIDAIDASGIPGKLPPHQLKSLMKRGGIDLDRITANLGDAAAYATGSSKSTLGGALAIEAENGTEAANTVSNVGLVLRADRVPGVTALGAGATGFTVRNASLGPKPLVVAAKGSRVAIGYGLRQTFAVLSGSGPTLASSDAFREAQQALGSTPLTGFVDGAAALRLAAALIPADERAAFGEARPYLGKISYLAIGGRTEDGLVRATLIAGLGR